MFARVWHGETWSGELFPWIQAGPFNVAVGAQVDQLTAVMLLVVTGVGFLIHVYSIGYMHGDDGYARFFTYLNLFVFSMVMLVLADNFLLLYVFWEAVGLCSYLLVGFWYQKQSAIVAGKKAFIVNRVGDFGFGLGVMLIWTTFGTLNYGEVFAAADASVGVGTYLAIALLLFMGATGKSAQLPLYTWLPDAMEGPTPVSALIHAATMVTAGVYMVARCHTLFEMAPLSLEVVAWIGTITAVFAASIGARPDRHQEGPRLLHDQPARLHVRGGRRGRLCRRPSSTSSATRSSRPCSSSARAASSTASGASRTCGRWAASRRG